MKLLKFILLATLIVSCNNDDTVEIQTCEMTDLGITETYKNPYPNATDDFLSILDWTWTTKNDGNILVLMYEESSHYSIHGEFQKYYYYFLINDDCVEQTGSAFVVFDNSYDIDENGNWILGNCHLSEDLLPLKLQYFNTNEKIVGRIMLNNVHKNFWVEFNEENHRDLTELEIASGL